MQTSRLAGAKRPNPWLLKRLRTRGGFHVVRGSMRGPETRLWRSPPTRLDILQELDMPSPRAASLVFAGGKRQRKRRSDEVEGIGEAAWSESEGGVPGTSRKLVGLLSLCLTRPGTFSSSSNHDAYERYESADMGRSTKARV